MATVLVATERESEFNLLSQTLAGSGYSLVRSKDGVEALDAIRTVQPEVLLANVLLPKLDGFALYRRCQQDEQLRRVPMVLFSTRSNDHKSERFAAEMGIEHFIGNALKSPQLSQMIDAARKAKPQPLPAVAALAPRPRESVSDIANGQEHTIARALPPPAPPPIQAVPVPAPVQPIQPAAPPVAVSAPPDKTTHTIGISDAERAEQERREWLQEQQRQLETLRTTQTQLEQAREAGELFNLSPAAMWIVAKASQRMLAVNDAALQLFGYARTEFLSLTSDALLKGGDAQAATQIKTFQTKDGRALSLLLGARDLTHAGQPAEMFTASDVSYRVRGERALAEELRRQRVLLAAVSVPYLVVNGAGRVLDANEHFLRLLGFRREQLVDKELTTLLAAPADLDAALSTGSTRQLDFRDHTQSAQLMSVTVNKVDMAGDIRMLVCTPRSETIAAPEASPNKLAVVLEMLRYAEDADETTLLHYAMAQLAQAFHSPLALFAALEPITQTLEALAIKSTTGLRPAAETTGNIPVPAPWLRLLSQCDTEVDMSADESMLVAGLPEISSYAACSITATGRAEHGKPAWLLVLANRELPFEASELTELRECAEVLATLLARKRAQFKLNATQQRQSASMDGMIGLIERMTDAHHAYAAGSGRRVAALAVNIARQLELNNERIQALTLAARVHDVGYLALPRELFLTPRTLSSSERALLKTHVEHGAKWLQTVDFGVDVASIVAQHHERLDGSGYPMGLRADQISIEARILAVADVVEAMTSMRAHRPAQDVAAALAELQAGSGSRYDTSVVNACERVFTALTGAWPVL